MPLCYGAIFQKTNISSLAWPVLYRKKICGKALGKKIIIPYAGRFVHQLRCHSVTELMARLAGKRNSGAIGTIIFFQVPNSSEIFSNSQTLMLRHRDLITWTVGLAILVPGKERRGRIALVLPVLVPEA